MSSAGSAWYDLNARVDQLEADLKAAEGKVAKSAKEGADAYEKPWQQGLGRVRESAGKVRNVLAGIGVGIGLATVVTFMAGAINAASDLNEEVTKSQVVFGDAADEVKAFAAGADVALGQSERQALAAAGAFGNMFRTIGLGEPEAARMSTTMVTLASDMASFNNQDPSEMLERLRSGLAGEAEPLRQFGVLLSEARVKAFAYENGIAAVGAQLTEAQKVQARYGVILQDTALQQGDFARTSDGLANTQRKNAAIWENTLARIGQALLPLAQSLANFASDVMPSVGDAVLDLIHVAEPMVNLLLTLGKLWIEHGTQLVPALAVALGIKLVLALRDATTRTAALDLAAKGLRATLLLGIPLIGEAKDAVNDWAAELIEGKEAAAALKRIQEELNTSEQDAVLIMKTLKREAEETGVPIDRLVTSFAYWYEQTGDVSEALRLMVEPTKAVHTGVDDLDAAIRDETRSMQESAAAHRAAANDMTETFNGLEAGVVEAINGINGVVKDSARAIPGGVAVELSNGSTLVAGSADELMAAVPGAVERAKEDAKAEARKIPGEIAASIIEGRDTVTQAAEGLATAATDPLTEQARIAELRSQLADLANITAEEIEAATPATIAADKAKYAELEILLAGHLLRQDPKSKEAAKLLAKYANSEEPATKAAYDALMTAVEDRADVMALNVEESAVDSAQALPEALDQARADVIAKAIQTTQAVLREAQNLENPMHRSGFTSGENLGEGVYSARSTARDNVARFGEFVSGPIRYMPSWVWGNNAGKSWGDGLLYSQTYVNDKAQQLKRGVQRFLEFAQSPPYTAVRRIGARVADEYIGSMAARMRAGDVLGQLGGARDAVGMVIGGASPAIAAQAAASSTTNFHVYTEGPTSVSTDDELARLMDRVLFVGQRAGVTP